MINKKYYLHFRTDFPFLLYQFIFNKSLYRKVDYYYIYTPNPFILSAYISRKGLNQAAKLGYLELIKNNKWPIIEKNAQIGIKKAKLLLKRRPDLENQKYFITWWKQLITQMNKVADSYFFCEAPVLNKLENLTSDTKIFKLLKKIGLYKLFAHKAISDLHKKLDVILHYICKNKLIAYNDIYYFDKKQFYKIINGNLSVKDLQIIKQRKKGVIQFYKNNKIFTLTENNFLKWKKILISSTNRNKERKGTTTYKGANLYLKGKVKKHYGFSSIIALNKDEILVTGMTNPQMIPYLKECKAIITDEGGLMCHAAILSRELKIPCIVGTGDCSQYLQDGDIILMDLKKGTVQKNEK